MMVKKKSRKPIKKLAKKNLQEVTVVVDEDAVAVGDGDVRS